MTEKTEPVQELEETNKKNIVNIKTQFTTAMSLEHNNSNLDKMDEINTWNLDYLNDELRRHQQSIDIEEENIRQFQEQIQNNIQEVRECRDQATKKESDLRQLHTKIECSRRFEEISKKKIYEQESQMKRLEHVRELKKEARIEKMVNLKKVSAEMKYKHLLTQLEKQRDKNEVDTSNSQIHLKNKLQHNRIYLKTTKNEKLIKYERDQRIEDNKKRVVNSKIEKEVGIIKQVAILKAKNKQKRERICTDFKNQETKLGTINNSLNANISYEKVIQKNQTETKNKESKVNSMYLVESRKRNKSMYDIQNEMKLSIGPADYKIPEHQFVTSNKITGSSIFISKNLPIWAEAVADPKLMAGANKRVWEKFGIGMDWKEMVKNKRKFDVNKNQSYLDFLTKSVKTKKPFLNQSQPYLKKSMKNNSLSNSQVLKETNLRLPISQMSKRKNMNSKFINSGSYKLLI